LVVGAHSETLECVLLSTALEQDNPKRHAYSSLGKHKNKSLVVGIDSQKTFHISVSLKI